ncbi:CoA ester lyase [Micromonospora sp. NPDC023956]|uniref:HpcH/HpaI aldolase/citrate lyase family protein n=1 Tax=Micromonospora sp. NPDC023956 TaxID=3155722 RepID=UPI0033E3692F
MVPRSWLYVPGHSPRMLAKAAGTGADAIIADLEDAVPPAERPAARTAVADWLDTGVGHDVAAWVRVSPDALDEDVAAVVRPGLAGVVVAKVDDPALLTRLDALLAALETERGLPRGAIAVSPRVESARGLRRIDAVAAAPRVLLLGLGEADLSADLGMRPGPDGLELLPARFEAVAASAAAGLAPPVGPATVDYRDLEKLRTSTAALRRLGFGGRTAIHPAQVAVINEVFTPTADEVATAERIVAAYAAGDGGAVAVAGTGTMVDEAVARSARAVLDRARR